MNVSDTLIEILLIRAKAYISLVDSELFLESMYDEELNNSRALLLRSLDSLEKVYIRRSGVEPSNG